MNDLPGRATGEWWWCLKHSRPEDHPDTSGDKRLGPYSTREDAENWRERVDARNEAWKADDDRWENGDEPA